MRDIGIYFIKSKIDGKLYIGKSVEIPLRVKDHFRRLKNKSHCNRHLQSSYNLNSKDNFESGILEYCSKDQLDYKESFYIIKYNATNEVFGFNFKAGGQGGEHSEEYKQKARISKKHTSKPVFAFSIDGVFIKSWDSISMCAIELNVSPCDVRRTINEWQRHCKGYVLNNTPSFRIRESNRGAHLKSVQKSKSHKEGDFIPGNTYVNLV